MTIAALARGRRKGLLNLGSLATIQIANAVSPLVIYPFLLAVVGAEGYSQVVVAEAMALLLLTFVLYSFDIDGVAAVVGRGEDKDGERLSRIYSEILVVRCSFYIAGLLVLQAVVHLVDPSLSMLVFGWSLVSLSHAIQPNWLYQALEWNHPAAVTTLVSRLGAVATILLTVRGPDDYALVPLQVGLWYLAGAVAAAAYAVRRFRLRLILPTMAELARLVWYGKEVFLGNLGVTLYRDVNVLLLSAFGVPASAVAAYSLAEKLVKSIQASIRPLNQFFFPRALAIAQAAKGPSPAVFARIGTLTVPQLGVVALLIVAVFVAYWLIGPAIPALARVENLDQVVALTAAMSLAAFPGLANFMFGSAGLNALGARRYLFGCILAVGAASVAANIVLIPLVGAMGSAAVFVLSESFLLALVAARYFRG